MTPLISSALKPSLLVFSCNKEHGIVKQHSFRKDALVFFNAYTQVHYVEDTQNKLQETSLHVYCLQWIWRNFSRGINISNDPLKFSDNDWLIGKQFIVLCVVKSVWCVENSNCHLGSWMQGHFQLIVTVLRNTLITFILFEAVGT